VSWYQSNPIYVEAKRCTPETAEEVANWCGGILVRDTKPSDHTDVRIYVKVPHIPSPLTAEATMDGGWYVLKNERSGKFEVMHPEKFERNFTIMQRDPYGE
jgi:hypothetical protein